MSGFGGGGAAPAGLQPYLNDFRLSCDASTPVTPTDKVAQSYLYATPNYKGNRITVLTEAGNWKTIAVPGATLDLAGLPANTNYDIVGKVNAANELVLEEVAWSSDSARFYVLERVMGRLAVNGYALLGSIRTSGAAVVEDSEAKRFISNLYNAELRRIAYATGTASHSYGTAAFRSWNNSTAHRAQWISTLQRAFAMLARGYILPSAAVSGNIAWGHNSTSAPTQDVGISLSASFTITAPGNALSTVGLNYAQLLEYASGVSTTFDYGSLDGLISC